MGLLNFFGKGPLSEKKISRVAKLAANPFAQPDVRMREMQRLIDDGSEVALKGVLRRFAANAQGHIADEEEKKWLENALVERGEAALAPLQAYVAAESKLTYALRALRRVAGKERAVDYFLKVLADYGPEDYRSGEAKLQLCWELAENLEEPRVIAGLAPFLRDHSDDVRWAVLELIEKASADEVGADSIGHAVVPHLTYLVTGDDVSQRIAQRAADLLSNRGWALPDSAGPLNPSLGETFFADKKHFVRKRAG